MTHPILSMLPDEARNLYLDQEIAEFEKRLSVERRSAKVGKLINVYQDLSDVGRSVALRSTRRSKR